MESREKKDDRLARIEKLMEEYRIKHEDLEAFLRGVRQRAADMREETVRVRETAHDAPAPKPRVRTRPKR